jgi:hypothetical protein
MANTDPVQIVVEIVDQFSDDLKDLRAELEKIDKKDIEPDFDIEDEGDIESIRAQLEALRKKIETDVEVDLDGATEAEAIVDAITRDRTVNVDMDTGNTLDDRVEQTLGEFATMSMNDIVDPYMLNQDTDRAGVPRLNVDFENALAETIRDNVDGAVADARPDMRGAFGGARRTMGGGGMPDLFAPRFPEGALPGDPLGDRGGNIGTDSFDFSGGPLNIFGRGSITENVRESLDDMSEGTSDLLDDLKKLMPSMRTWMNMVAAIVPMLITLAAGALGVAAAFGALAVAGAGIIGLGLLGWGDSMSESLQNVKREAQQMGSELFGVFQPVSNAFQPILEDWMEGIPHAMQGLVDPLKGLTVFEDELESAGGGLIGWIAEALELMSSMDEMIGQIAMRFGEAIGDTLLKLFAGLINEVYKNQDAYMNLGAILVDLIVILFEISKTISFVIAQFKPFFDVATALVSLLANKWTVAVLTAIGAVLALEAALTVLGAAYAGITALAGASATAIAAKYLPAIAKAITGTWAWVTAANALYATLARLAVVAGGIGILLAGGSMLIGGAMDSMSGPNGRGGNRPMQQGPGGGDIIVQGDVREREMDRIQDIAGNTAQREMDFGGS